MQQGEVGAHPGALAPGEHGDRRERPAETPARPLATTGPRKPNKPEPEPAAAAAPITATFVSGDPALTRLTAKCHNGTPTGDGPVLVKMPGPGPCKITGTAADGTSRSARLVLSEGGSYTCFAGGGSDCR